MADMGPGGRRRRRRGGIAVGSVKERPSERDRIGDREKQSDKERVTADRGIREKEMSDKESSVAVQPSKPPIILAKPPERKDSSGIAPPALAVSDKPSVVMIKTRDEVKTTSGTAAMGATSQVTSDSSHGDSHQAPVYHIHRHHTASSSEVSVPQQQLPRLVLPPEMRHSMKLVDDSLQWCDNGMEMLMDQTDFLVVGVMGLQGVGKSTLMSMLAGGVSFNEGTKKYPFRPQSNETKDIGGHQTQGVDFLVTNERVILLDTQPILSASVLDQLIRHEKILPAEITTAENCVELQSLQLAAFLFTVCHVILVVQNWTEDVNMLQFILRAEMLKPPTPSPNIDSSTGSCDDSLDYCPQIGALSLVQSKALANITKDLPDTEANLFLIPLEESRRTVKNEGISSLLSDYKGHPGMEAIIRSFRNTIFSAARPPLAHTSLTEKNWFHYAARTWDGVKKSNLVSEFSRLL
ncbi:nonsense-mediated mRNA decay factor SMG9-like [Saccoglossus kowalevskii]|uniref:Protein SMG9-like n=1 Tax=Saccoglossus kowalevskii TaxID=10224 RepID=A0ABM0M3L5_SACKO|nr:PREDICTED: protein SMG9-like [Saccoglossus kowalevskii]